MLGSFSSSHEDREDPDHTSSSSISDLHYHHHQMSTQPPTLPVPSSSIQMRQLLLTCSELLERSNFSAAYRLLSFISSSSSPFGDSSDRLLHHFSLSLSLRLHRLSSPSSPQNTTYSFLTNLIHFPTSSNHSNIFSVSFPSHPPLGPEPSNQSDPDSLQSCYLSLNRVTPFIRFSHLTANQAILDAIQGENAVHILDMDIMHGVQWPPLMQALAERNSSDNNNTDPTTLRITGCGRDSDILRRTGDRLSKFAQSLSLIFQFIPLVVNETDSSCNGIFRVVSSVPGETLAVNCTMYLHRLLRDDSRELCSFLRRIKGLKPKVVTVAEREASHNCLGFLRRLAEAIEHYAAVFDSLEATLPPNSRERLELEEVWFGREIRNIVVEEGDRRKERHERFEYWEGFLRSTGFSNVPLSPFALSQAKLLLRLHYPSEGYQLQFDKNAVFLGWQNRALFSVSSWH